MRGIGSQACNVDLMCKHVVFLNCFGIELMLCDLNLTRFVLTKGFLFDTFFIVFFTNCVVVITEYLNSNLFHINELVNQTRHYNQMDQRQYFFMQMIHLRQDCVWKECAAGKTYIRKCAAGKNSLAECCWLLCPLDVICKSLFTNHRPQSSFFNWITNLLIHRLNNLGPTQSIFVCLTACDTSTGSSREVETTVFDPASQFLSNISRRALSFFTHISRPTSKFQSAVSTC